MVVPCGRTDRGERRSGGRECEIEGGAGGLSAGCGGRRPLRILSVKKSLIIFLTAFARNCAIPSRPMARRRPVMRTVVVWRKVCRAIAREGTLRREERASMLMNPRPSDHPRIEEGTRAAEGL